jgi:hypothetical protein
VVQAYKDVEKDTVLTQSPTIQRVSQRLILALTAMLPHLQLYLRDITQAYTQSKTELVRQFFVRPPIEMQLPPGSILRVVKPLYSVPEAGNHWYNTYHSHHVEKLGMNQSTYDPCLLYTVNAGNSNNNTGFGVVGLQTDDTLFLGDEVFAIKEAEEIENAGLKSKERVQLNESQPLKFNGGNITINNGPNRSILLTQERQCQCITLVEQTVKDLKSSRGTVRKDVAFRDQYVAQRARGVYVATVSQPEAAFDLSFTA